MTQYVHFTEQQKRQASEVDLESFLASRGEKLTASGRDKRLACNRSITIHENEWYDHATGQGGHSVSLVQKLYGLSYPEAVQLLLGGGGRVYPQAQHVQRQRKPFSLPEANKDMRHVFAYLTKYRKISGDVVTFFAKAKTLYEESQYHNAVFVGLDENGVARHGHKRSTNSDGRTFRINIEGSEPKYSFHHIGTDDSLYVFEAPIDLMSFLTICPDNWPQHSYVACCGLSMQPVEWVLDQLPYKNIYLCYDNDEAGNKASDSATAVLAEKGYHIQRLSPIHKDWNDDLVLESEAIECPTFGC